MANSSNCFFILNLRRDDGPNLNSIQLKKCNLKLYLILVSLYVLFFNLTLCLIRYPKRIHIPLLTFLFFLLIFNSMFIDVKSKQKIRTQTKFLICLLTIILLFFYIHSFYVQNKKLDKINNYKQKSLRLSST